MGLNQQALVVSTRIPLCGVKTPDFEHQGDSHIRKGESMTRWDRTTRMFAPREAESPTRGAGRILAGKKGAPRPRLNRVHGSENLRSLAYRNGDLYVRFHGDPTTVYVFEKVPEHVYEDLVNADSIDSEFAEKVRDRFAFHKIERP